MSQNIGETPKRKRRMVNVELDPESAEALDRAKQFGATPSRFIRQAIKAQADKLRKEP